MKYSQQRGVYSCSLFVQRTNQTMHLFLGSIPTLCTVFNRPSSETVSQSSHIYQSTIKQCYLASYMIKCHSQLIPIALMQKKSNHSADAFARKRVEHSHILLKMGSNHTIQLQSMHITLGVIQYTVTNKRNTLQQGCHSLSLVHAVANIFHVI